jgi:TatD DNase family protein
MDKWEPGMADRIARLAQSDRRVVAIGETGLDFYKATDEVTQKSAFGAQLAIARSLELPVIIHCREAAAPMVELLQQFWQEQGPVAGVMHCWAGTPEEMEEFLDLGLYISFSGIVTFKNADAVKASALKVPSDRILIETDCPFLSPVPKRKERRNQPAYVRHVAEYLAELRGTDLNGFAQQTTANAARLFNLPLLSQPSVPPTSPAVNQYSTPSPTLVTG